MIHLPVVERGPRRELVLTLFLLSGATALTYEVVWTRMLTLVFGATTLSVGSVLAAYMAGLALGAWYWSRRADHTTRPLRLYAALELGVVLTALLTPLLFAGVQVVYRALFVGGLSDFSALSWVRFFLCLPVLLAPTFLMGGTLPVLARFYTTNLAQIGRGAGDLYAVNTFGAVAGTLLAGFVALPTLGVRGTLFAAAALNLTVAVLAWGLSRQAGETPPAVRAPAAPWRVPEAALGAVLVGFALSGFAAMVLEVVWTRALVLIFGNSTYAFTTMLAAFLIGLALGAALAGPQADRARYPFFALAMVELGIGIWAAVATPLIEWLPPVFVRAYDWFGGSFGALQVVQFVVCCLVMLPATLGLGAVFPLVSKVFAQRAGGAAQSVGVPYAANTIGTVFGALLAGFVFLPTLGLERSVVLAGAIYLLVSALILVASREVPVRPVALAGAGLVGLVAVGHLAVVRLDPLVMGAGVYIKPDRFTSTGWMRAMAKSASQEEVVYQREGWGASITVLRYKIAGGGLVLRANGKTDASTGDLPTQVTLAHLPMLLHPRAKEVLVVGLASGCTAGSVLLYPVDRVECVEIEPAMVEACRFFAPWNHNVLEDPRYHTVLQDARNFVLMTDRQYDVITAEPTNPWIAGVNNLFTVEYYRHCQARLRPGGIMCQWMPGYNFSPEELRTALRTFAVVFPHVTVWSFPKLRSDLFVVGSMEPVQLDLEAVAAGLAGPARRDLETMRVSDRWSFLAALLLDDAHVRQYSQGAPLNTDDRPRLEFSTPRHLYHPTVTLPTMRGLYLASLGSAMPFAPKQAGRVLDWLGLTFSGPVAEAEVRAYHPDPVASLQEDAAEVRLRVAGEAGETLLRVAALLRVATLPESRWPDSMASDWLLPSGDWLPPGIRGPVASTRSRVAGQQVMWEVPAGPEAQARLQKLAGRLRAK